MVGKAGVTAMDWRTGTVTVRVVCPDIPFKVAEMTDVPTATAVARPEVLIVATVVVAEFQVTCPLMSFVLVEPSAFL